MAVIGRQHGDTELRFQLEELFADAVFLRQSLVLDLEEEIVFAEELAILPRRSLGLRVLPFHEVFAHFASKTPRKPDQSLGVLGKEALADARLVIEAVHRRF